MDAHDFLGAEPVADSAAFSAARLADYLRAHVPGCEGRLTVERFRGGQSNPTLLLSFDGRRRLVLRKKPDGKLLPSAHAIDREFRVTSALKDSGVPVARPHHLCTDESIVGAMFYIMDYVEGRTFWNPALPDLADADRGAIYAEMNRVIARLHGVDWRAAGLEGFGKPADYVARQIARWSAQYRASETERIEAMERLLAWLPENVPAQRTTAIVHGDYRIDNMIFDPVAPRILAVVDWELATLGEPLADFAYHTLTWHLPRMPYRGLADADPARLGIPVEAVYRDAYLKATGQGDVSEREWNIYLSYSLFRVAGIRQGIMKRVVDGTASSPFAREAGALARPVAELAWAFAERAMRS